MDETINELLNEINHTNIDNMIYFYSSLLERIVSKKLKFEKDEALFKTQIKRINSVKSELLLEEDSDETSDSD